MQQHNEQMNEFMINEAEEILKQLQCAVCLNEVDNPALTRCGHSYCFACIEEAVNRHRKCPLCNFELQMSDVFLNLHLNSIKNHLKEEREKKLNQAAQQIFGKSFLPDANILSSMFKQAIVEMYSVYEGKYIEAVEEFKAKMATINSRYLSRKAEYPLGVNHKEIAQLTLEHEEQVKSLQNNYEQLKQYYVGCLRQTLEQFKCDKSAMDIFTIIQVPSKNVEFQQIFKISSRLSHVKQALVHHFQGINDPITKILIDSIQVSFCRPEDSQHLLGLIKAKQFDAIRQEFRMHSISDDLLLASLGLRQGAVVFIIGDFETRSQQPVQCLTYKFQKDGKAIDYFTCLQCNIHWVCQSCKDYCHSQHKVLLYKGQTVPEWACCYCASKGFCKALNKNSK